MSEATPSPEYVPTLVIGAGQSGLSVGHHLSRLGLEFLIVDAHDRVGDVWRERWDSLRLFTPAWLDTLDGLPFPAPRHYFPTKDEMADYLESYARRFELPVLTGTRVDQVARRNGGFVVRAGARQFETDNVVVAMSSYQQPSLPAFAAELDPAIVQIHSADYRNPGQLPAGAVLLVGAGNSGSEIAMELAARNLVWMSGRDVGHLPFRLSGWPARLLLARLMLRGVFHHLLSVRNPIGRRVRAKIAQHGGPLIRVHPVDLEAAGVRRVPRTVGARAGLPLLADGRALEVANVIWCSGFRAPVEWIDLPAHDGDEPPHQSGIVPAVPGLYFVGRHFLHALSSAMIHGVGRDAERVARAIAARRRAGSPAAAGAP
jgi:putative flavoprotein involved in K+ transport